MRGLAERTTGTVGVAVGGAIGPAEPRVCRRRQPRYSIGNLGAFRRSVRWPGSGRGVKQNRHAFAWRSKAPYPQPRRTDSLWRIRPSGLKWPVDTQPWDFTAQTEEAGRDDLAERNPRSEPAAGFKYSSPAAIHLRGGSKSPPKRGNRPPQSMVQMRKLYRPLDARHLSDPLVCDRGLPARRRSTSSVCMCGCGNNTLGNPEQPADPAAWSGVSA